MGLDRFHTHRPSGRRDSVTEACVRTLAARTRLEDRVRGHARLDCFLGACVRAVILLSDTRVTPS